MPSTGVLILKELGGLNREVRFEGRNRPYRPFEPETRHEKAVERYPGNPKKTVQMLGPSDEPVIFTGTIKDKFNSDGFAAEMERTLRGISNAGELLSVETMDWSRSAVMARFKPGKTWPGYLEWEIELEILDTGEDTASVSSALAFTSVDTPSMHSDRLTDSAALVTSARDAAPIGALGSALTTFDNSMSLAYQSVEELAAEVNNSRVVTTVRRVMDSARRASSAASGIRLRVDEARTSLRGLTPQTAIAMADGLSILRSTTFLDNLSTTVRRLGTNARLAERFFTGVALEEVRTIIYGRAGTNLSELAQRYYQDPHQWVRIAQTNGLADNRLSASVQLVIPT